MIAWKLSLYKAGLILLVVYNVLRFVSESNLDYYDHFIAVYVLQTAMVFIFLYILVRGWITNKKRDFLFSLINVAFLVIVVYFVLQLVPSSIALFQL